MDYVVVLDAQPLPRPLQVIEVAIVRPGCHNFGHKNKFLHTFLEGAFRPKPPEYERKISKFHQERQISGLDINVRAPCPNFGHLQSS